MKLSFELSNLAQSDLNQIWIYSLDTWSMKQADKYYQQLILGINTICTNPEIGKSIREIKETHRVFKIKSHLIVYKVEGDVVFIDRILHERMDIDSQLTL